MCIYIHSQDGVNRTEMAKELKVAVIGPAGHAGLELTRRLFQHPRLKTPLLLSPDAKGETSLAGRLPDLKLNGEGTVHPFSWSLVHRLGVDLLFVAASPKVGRTLAPEAAAHGLLMIDLGGSRESKGAAAEAVRRMNMHYGWDASEGLA